MSNTFKSRLSEEIQQEMHDSVEEKVSVFESLIKRVLSGGKFSSLRAVSYLPFMLFVFFLTVVYIANRHYTENTVRHIDRVANEVKVLSWEYKTLQADLMLKSTQSEIASKVDALGLKVLVEPPVKIRVNESKKK